MTHSRITLRERHKSQNDGFLVWTPSGREGPHFEPSSVDLRLGNEFLHPEPQDEPVQVWNEDTYPEYQREAAEKPVIPSQSFVLADTEEVVKIPRDTVGFLHGRSSVGRLGLFIHNAGLVDAGFDGSLTLELFNPAPYPIQLKSGMRIAQMTAHKHDKAPNVGYSRRNENKYDGQEGPTPSRLYEDFD